jgi:alpha-glucan,water dikinase
LGFLKGYLPTVALPFGVFERVLAEEKNREIAKLYEELTLRINKEAKKLNGEVLGELRKTILALKAPDGLASSLHKVMEGAGLAWPASWDDAWMCIKRVWSSKWNERAHLSRGTRGIAHGDLFMAVLIQEVVEADYSFVIHTANPLTGERDEIYAEVVLGLGETLVGNYPGRALSYTCRKGESEPRLLAFPSKSAGLFGSGLIFRSDSSGEDLASYAGAGLYDSVMLPLSRKVSLDYSRERLVWDESFRRDLLVTIATIGTMVEKAMGFPQDIEGAYSKGRYYVVQTRPQVGLESE